MLPHFVPALGTALMRRISSLSFSQLAIKYEHLRQRTADVQPHGRASQLY